MEFIRSLESTLLRLRQRLKVQVLFVDNGSTDSSHTLLLSQSRDLLDFGVLVLTRNFGYETALIAGLSHANGDLFALCDSDGEDPVGFLISFLDAIEEGFEIAIGIRRKRHEPRRIQWLRNAGYVILSKMSD